MKTEQTLTTPEAPEAAQDDRFNMLLEKSQEFCESVGLSKGLILEIARTDSDWAFILKIDALLETASKEILRRGLKLDILGRVIRNNTLGDFVDSLPMGGRTSLLTLLKAAGCPSEEHGFIESTRRVRNAYAHNIRNVDAPLIELITRRTDKSHLIRNLSAIEKYDEAELIARYRKEPGMLRFGILDSTMRFLFYAYHITH